jgi:hypothetical protein
MIHDAARRPLLRYHYRATGSRLTDALPLIVAALAAVLIIRTFAVLGGA